MCEHPPWNGFLPKILSLYLLKVTLYLWAPSHKLQLADQKMKTNVILFIAHISGVFEPFTNTNIMWYLTLNYTH